MQSFRRSHFKYLKQYNNYDHRDNIMQQAGDMVRDIELNSQTNPLPYCNETVSDYEVWWKQDDIWSGKPEVFDCEKCNKSLTVEWVKDEYEYWVSNFEINKVFRQPKMGNAYIKNIYMICRIRRMNVHFVGYSYDYDSLTFFHVTAYK